MRQTLPLAALLLLVAAAASDAAGAMEGETRLLRYPDIHGDSLTFVYAQSNPEIAAIAQILRDNLRMNLGITVDLRENEAATLRTDIFAQKIAFTITDWAPDYIDPQNFLSTLLRSGAPLNHFGYSNARFDAFCDRADAETDERKRDAFYREADQLAMDEIAIFPYAYIGSRLLVRPQVHGLRTNLIGTMPHTQTSVG